MYKLTVEFKNNEELAAFVIKIGGVTPDMNVKHVMDVAVEQSPAVVEEPKKEKKPAKKKETVVDQGAEVEVPPVIEVPKIDRDAVIGQVSSGIKQLQELGVSGQDIAAKLAHIYVNTNCPAGVKIGSLDDTQLAAFFPHFQAFLAEAKNAKLATTQTQSFV